LPVRYHSAVAAGPGVRTYREWSWRVCLVTPMGPSPWTGYRGSVRMLDVAGPRPSELRACFSSNSSSLGVIPCSERHRGEIVAMQPVAKHVALPADSELATSRLTSCREASRAFTGADDPTYGGQLNVVILPDNKIQLSGPLSADTGAYYTSSDDAWLLCTLIKPTPSGPQLVGSVAGWGNRPLPLG
jgi:hypothetical protein